MQGDDVLFAGDHRSFWALLVVCFGDTGWDSTEQLLLLQKAVMLLAFCVFVNRARALESDTGFATIFWTLGSYLVCLCLSFIVY